MTRIDFHSNVSDKLAYVCRLIRKAHAANCKLVVYHREPTVLKRLDEALWTFSDTDFLPHVMRQNKLAAMTSIVLSDSDQIPCPHYELLINLTSRAPENFTAFQRMIEIISADEQDKLAGRERYRHYQQQGHNLTHFVAK